jgi:hypothetical protein
MARRADLLTSPDEDWAERMLHEAIARSARRSNAPPPIEEAMVILRRAKDAAHLAAAIADLARLAAHAGHGRDNRSPTPRCAPQLAWRA